MPDIHDREFPPMPDEFEGQGMRTEEASPERRKSMKWLLSAAAVLLILPMLVLPQLAPGASGTGPAPGPGPGPVVPEAGYAIIGAWSNGTESYVFTEDGNGFYTNGDYYIVISWEKQEDGRDYDYSGFGVDSFDGKPVTLSGFSQTTQKAAGGLMLHSCVSKQTELFAPAGSVYAPDVMNELYGTLPEERLYGFWERQYSLDPDADVCSHYLNLGSEHYGTLHAGTVSGSVGDYFTILYAVEDERSPVFIFGREDGEKMVIEYRNSTGGTDSYSANDLTAFYFIDREGEGIVISAFGAGTVLRRGQGN